MIASRAVKVYKICRRYKEEYVTTVFTTEDANAVGIRLNKELDITGVRYRNLAGALLATVHRNKPEPYVRPSRRSV
mgnify:FL=1|jgi:hypothetical protein|tara:strand:+ start:382 stop:609 length:228 start_codon:yes stop_codon:yes gene_type:complete